MQNKRYEKLKKENEILKERLRAKKYQDKELIRLFKDMQQCYLSNRKLCEWQEIHISKLADIIKGISDCIDTLTSVDNDFANSETYLRIKKILDDAFKISKE